MDTAARRNNVESVMKSFELEGFVYTDEEKAVFEKVASGEISFDQARKIFFKQLGLA